MELDLAALYQDVSRMIKEEKHSEASVLEEKIAQLLLITHVEGMLARRGAVLSAIFAEDYERAIRLGRQYIEESWKTETSTEEHPIQADFCCMMFDWMMDAENKREQLVACPPKPA